MMILHGVSDALGSVYALVDADHELVSRYGYDVYGTRSAASESIPTKFGFTGRVHDTGDAVYYRARYMDAGTGTWLARDPIGLTPSGHGDSNGSFFIHPYAYGMSPPNFTDPLGLFRVWTHETMTRYQSFMYLHWTYQDTLALSNKAVDEDQGSDFKHYMRESGPGSGAAHVMHGSVGRFLGMGTYLCVPNTWAEDPALARIGAEHWINENIDDAYESTCNGDTHGAMKSLGYALHTIQDQFAHDVEGVPATWFQHCAMDMDSPGYLLHGNPTAIYDAERFTRSTVASFILSIPVAQAIRLSNGH